MTRVTCLLGFAMVAAALTLTGCDADGKTLPAQGAPPGVQAAVSVSAAAVTQKSVPVTIDVIAIGEAISAVAVRAQITGELTSVNFKDGDEVAKGQELFALDRRPLEASLRQMQANLDRDVAQLANARAQLQRYQDLSDHGIATREQLDLSRTNTAALEATAAADRAAVENATVQLAYATIRAPLAGRAGRLLVSAGNLVRASDTAPLVVINQVSPIYATFGIPEARMPDLRRYMARGALRVEARPPTDSGPPSIGRLAFIDNAVDQSTGTIAVRATFPNDDRRVWPGQFLNVTVVLDTDPNATVVPASAVQESQQGSFVFVVKPDQTVERRAIHVIRTAGAETVVAGSLQAGEMVVTDGQLRLVPGSKVMIRPAGRSGAPS